MPNTTIPVVALLPVLPVVVVVVETLVVVVAAPVVVVVMVVVVVLVVTVTTVPPVVVLAPINKSPFTVYQHNHHRDTSLIRVTFNGIR